MLTASFGFLVAPFGAENASASLAFSWKKKTEISFSAESCTDQETRRITFPEGAIEPRILSGPEVGDVLIDEFEEPVAKLTALELRIDADGRHRIYASVSGNGAACLDEDGDDYGWETDYVRFVLGYKRYERVWFNEFYAQGSESLTRQRPSWIKCGSDCSWRKLRWRRWGERTAKATGYYRYVNKTIAGNTAREYPVIVTLSRPGQCYSRVRYLRMSTHFTRSRPPGVRSRYKVEHLSCARGIF